MNTDKIYAEAMANEYAPKENSKVKALKKLDKKAKMMANLFIYVFGLIMLFIFGIGMCIAMNGIDNRSQKSFVVGSIVEVIGMVGISMNYPIYKKLLENGKQKYAFEIMQLAKEISETSE